MRRIFQKNNGNWDGSYCNNDFEFKKDNLSLGRVNNSDHVCLMKIDIRLGRTEKQKLELVITFNIGVENFFGVNKKIISM